MNYNLELEKTIKQINKSKAKSVCIQLPDGLKPKAKEIADKIEKNPLLRISLNEFFEKE